MRNVVRRSIFLGSLLTGLFVWAACGDDDNAVVSGTDAGRDAPADVTPDRAPTIVVADDSGPDDGGKVLFEAGPHDAGPVSVVLDGGDIDGGIPCTSDGELELEPNDTMGTANTMNPPLTRCGVLRVLNAIADAGADAGDGGDAAPDPIETDWMTFRTTAGARDYYVQYQGDGLQIFVQNGDDGGLFDITANPPPTLPFHPSLPYYIKIRSKDGQPHVWRVTLFQDF